MGFITRDVITTIRSNDSSENSKLETVNNLKNLIAFESNMSVQLESKRLGLKRCILCEKGVFCLRLDSTIVVAIGYTSQTPR